MLPDIRGPILEAELKMEEDGYIAVYPVNIKI